MGHLRVAHPVRFLLVPFHGLPSLILQLLILGEPFLFYLDGPDLVLVRLLSSLVLCGT